MLARHVHLPEGLCTPHFVQRAEELLDRLKYPATLALPTRGFLVLRALRKKMRRGHERDIHRRNIFPDTSLQEVADRFEQVSAAAGLDVHEHVRIRQIRPNIFDLVAE